MTRASSPRTRSATRPVTRTAASTAHQMRCPVARTTTPRTATSTSTVRRTTRSGRPVRTRRRSSRGASCRTCRPRAGRSTRSSSCRATSRSVSRPARRTRTGCTVPPSGPGDFYPYWTRVTSTGSGHASCTLEFGNVSRGTGVNDFGGDAQYGSDLQPTLGYPEFEGPVMSNACRSQARNRQRRAASCRH